VATVVRVVIVVARGAVGMTETVVVVVEIAADIVVAVEAVDMVVTGTADRVETDTILLLLLHAIGMTAVRGTMEVVTDMAMAAVGLVVEVIVMVVVIVTVLLHQEHVMTALLPLEDLLEVRHHHAIDLTIVHHHDMQVVGGDIHEGGLHLEGHQREGLHRQENAHHMAVEMIETLDQEMMEVMAVAEVVIMVVVIDMLHEILDLPNMRAVIVVVTMVVDGMIMVHVVEAAAGMIDGITTVTTVTDRHVVEVVGVVVAEADIKRYLFKNNNLIVHGLHILRRLSAI